MGRGKAGGGGGGGGGGNWDRGVVFYFDHGMKVERMACAFCKSVPTYFGLGLWVQRPKGISYIANGRNYILDIETQFSHVARLLRRLHEPRSTRCCKETSFYERYPFHSQE